MDTLNTVLFFMVSFNALFLAYLIGQVRESQRQTKIQDRLVEKLVAAYQTQK
jgi:hypothetical protein